LFSKENIPDRDVLYMRIHELNMRGDKPKPAAFDDHGQYLPGMSVDWSRYSTVSETRARNPKKPASVYGVGQFIAGNVRAIQDLKVEHSPSRKNRAHSEVFGNKDEQTRVELGRICSVIIFPGEPT
jgi:hypothetical protein